MHIYQYAFITYILIIIFILLQIGNGYITTQVLKEILKELDSKLSEDDLDGIVEEIDEDGSGTVDFDGK